MQISVIIPALNEAECIEHTLEKTRDLGDAEILVVDGGSTDETPKLCGAADKVIVAPKGRANQMNAGAAAATGDVLLFLHADCWLEPGSLEAVRDALDSPQYVGGCFQQRIDARGWRFRALEWGNALRVRCWGLAYGDQGIFVRRKVFDRLEGFPQVKLMEDLLFVKRLRREGKLALLEPRIHLSARRWQQRGVVRQTLSNWRLIALARAGVHPDKLTRYYPHVR